VFALGFGADVAKRLLAKAP